MFNCYSSSNCKNSFMDRKKIVMTVNFLKSPEYFVCIVIKMKDVAAG